MEHLLQVDDLSVAFRRGCQVIYALSGLSFSVEAGECLAIIGESGCGKSTVAKAVMGILDRNAQILSGSVRFRGENLLSLSERQRRRLMGRHISMVFQNPMTTLDPSYSVYYQIREFFHTHLGRCGDYRQQVLELLAMAQLADPEAVMRQYPFELSGGMCQRISLVMACALNPGLIIADEPTSALDVSTQAKFIELLRQLTIQNGLALLLITHDLGVVAELADRVMVLYSGQRVEEQQAQTFFDSPKHPYSKGLLLARPHNFSGRFYMINGSVAVSTTRAEGCAFCPRCDVRQAICSDTTPADRLLPNGVVRCHLQPVGEIEDA